MTVLPAMAITVVIHRQLEKCPTSHLLKEKDCSRIAKNRNWEGQVTKLPTDETRYNRLIRRAMPRLRRIRPLPNSVGAISSLRHVPCFHREKRNEHSAAGEHFTTAGLAPNPLPLRLQPDSAKRINHGSRTEARANSSRNSTANQNSNSSGRTGVHGLSIAYTRAHSIVDAQTRNVTDRSAHGHIPAEFNSDHNCHANSRRPRPPPLLYTPWKLQSIALRMWRLSSLEAARDW